MFSRKLAAVLVAASTLIAAPSLDASEAIEVRISKAGEQLARATVLERLGSAERERLVQFMVGNAVFTLGHEVGHALVSDLRLPVLGREEDAVDMFASLALLHVGNDFAVGALMDTAKGLMLTADRLAKAGVLPAYYGEHGLDRQRAYKIVCMMIGSDSEGFRDLAEQTMLPQDRQQTCEDDFELAKASWLSLLAPNLRRDARREMSFSERLSHRFEHRSLEPVRIDIRHGPVAGELRYVEEIVRTTEVLEMVRDFVMHNFAGLRGPLTLEAKTCNTPNAFWDPRERLIVLCYEFVNYHADLGLSLLEKR